MGLIRTVSIVGLVLVLCFVLVLGTVSDDKIENADPDPILVPEDEIENADLNPIVVPDDYLTISEAVEKVSEGGVVLVKSGIYPETVVVNKSLSLIGENPQTTIINGQNNGPAVYVDSSDVTVANFTVINGDTPAELSPYFPYSTRLAGIHVMANDCRLLNNTIMNSGCGVWLYNSNNNQIVGNNILNNSNGVFLEFSSGNCFESNFVTNSWNGIDFESSSGNVLRSNTFCNVTKSLGVRGNQLPHFVNDVDTSNTVDGNPFQYLINQKDLVLDPSTVPDLDFILLVNCTNMTIQNFHLANQHNSIHLAFTDNSRIMQNTVFSPITLDNSSYNMISGNTASVFLESSSRNKLENNTGAVSLQYSSSNGVRENTITGFERGISLGFSSRRNNIQRNNITANRFGIMLYSGCSINFITENNITKNADSGIWIEGTSPSSDSNEIIDNNISENAGWGILARSSYGNLIQGNNFADNQEGGIWLSGDSSKNWTVIRNSFVNNKEGLRLQSQYPSEFYHNNFINNTRQVLCSSVESAVNIWDDGYPYGGNYWSNYVGEDTDNDGIGETPHAADSGNKDNYPLIAPITYFYTGPWDWIRFGVDIVSNSSVSDFHFSPQGTITFTVETKPETTGFCRIRIHKNLMHAIENRWTVLANGNPITPTLKEEPKNTFLAFNYGPDTTTITISGTHSIPEFSSWISLPLFLIATFVVSFYCIKLSKK